MELSIYYKNIQWPKFQVVVIDMLITKRLVAISLQKNIKGLEIKGITSLRLYLSYKYD
jgi:hypothetical protein